MFNRTRYLNDYGAGYEDASKVNPVKRPRNRTGEALEAYETGFEDAEADMAEYQSQTG